MYVKTYATVFSSKLESTEKLTHRSLSISNKKADGTFESEYWTGKFVGKAKEVIDALPEKSRVLIQGNVHNGYDKEKKAYYPYILVTVVEQADGE